MTFFIKKETGSNRFIRSNKRYVSYAYSTTYDYRRSDVEIYIGIGNTSNITNFVKIQSLSVYRVKKKTRICDFVSKLVIRVKGFEVFL